MFRIITDSPPTPGHLLPGSSAAIPRMQEYSWVARLAWIWGTGNPRMAVSQLVGKASLEASLWQQALDLEPPDLEWH